MSGKQHTGHEEVQMHMQEFFCVSVCATTQTIGWLICSFESVNDAPDAGQSAAELASEVHQMALVKTHRSLITTIIHPHIADVY